MEAVRHQWAQNMLTEAIPGLWVTRDATRTTNRGTQRRKRYVMFVLTIWGGRPPNETELALKRSIDLVAKTRQPRTERRGGMFTEGHEQNIRLVKDADVIVQCYGAHILRFSSTNPTGGDVIPLRGHTWMTWDDHPVDTSTLQDLLQLLLDPDTLKPLETDTMHKPRVKEPGLFDIGTHDLDEKEDNDD